MAAVQGHHEWLMRLNFQLGVDTPCPHSKPDAENIVDEAPALALTDNQLKEIYDKGP